MTPHELIDHIGKGANFTWNPKCKVVIESVYWSYSEKKIFVAVREVDKKYNATFQTIPAYLEKI